MVRPSMSARCSAPLRSATRQGSKASYGTTSSQEKFTMLSWSASFSNALAEGTSPRISASPFSYRRKSDFAITQTPWSTEESSESAPQPRRKPRKVPRSGLSPPLLAVLGRGCTKAREDDTLAEEALGVGRDGEALEVLIFGGILRHSVVNLEDARRRRREQLPGQRVMHRGDSWR